MRNRIAVVAAALAGLVVGCAATAAADWKVMKTVTKRGSVVTYATASAKTLEPNALAVRASGPVKVVEWSVTCSGIGTSSSSGKTLEMSVQSANGCSVLATASGDAGTLRLQLLRR